MQFAFELSVKQSLQDTLILTGLMESETLPLLEGRQNRSESHRCTKTVSHKKSNRWLDWLIWIRYATSEHIYSHVWFDFKQTIENLCGTILLSGRLCIHTRAPKLSLWIGSNTQRMLKQYAEISAVWSDAAIVRANMHHVQNSRLEAIGGTMQWLCTNCQLRSLTGWLHGKKCSTERLNFWYIFSWTNHKRVSYAIEPSIGRRRGKEHHYSCMVKSKRWLGCSWKKWLGIADPFYRVHTYQRTNRLSLVTGLAKSWLSAAQASSCAETIRCCEHLSTFRSHYLCRHAGHPTLPASCRQLVSPTTFRAWDLSGLSQLYACNQAQFSATCLNLAWTVTSLTFDFTLSLTNLLWQRRPQISSQFVRLTPESWCAGALGTNGVTDCSFVQRFVAGPARAWWVNPRLINLHNGTCYRILAGSNPQRPSIFDTLINYCYLELRLSKGRDTKMRRRFCFRDQLWTSKVHESSKDVYRKGWLLAWCTGLLSKRNFGARSDAWEKTDRKQHGWSVTVFSELRPATKEQILPSPCSCETMIIHSWHGSH